MVCYSFPINYSILRRRQRDLWGYLRTLKRLRPDMISKNGRGRHVTLSFFLLDSAFCIMHACYCRLSVDGVAGYQVLSRQYINISTLELGIVLLHSITTFYPFQNRGGTSGNRGCSQFFFRWARKRGASLYRHAYTICCSNIHNEKITTDSLYCPDPKTVKLLSVTM